MFAGTVGSQHVCKALNSCNRSTVKPIHVRVML